MIDTIRLQIKNITLSDMEQIKTTLSTCYTVNNDDGSIQHQFTKGSLRGSWDYQIRVFVRDTVFQSVEVEDKPFYIGKHEIKRTRKKTMSFACPEYLVIEFSLPKWTEGHNLLNSTLSQDLIRMIEFRKWLCVQFGVILPDMGEWEVTRVDMGNNFPMFHIDAVKNFIDIFSSLRYPRRKKPTVFDTSIKWHGNTAIKLYAKGPEFKVHDFQRLKRSYDRDKLNFVSEYADEILRYEIEFRKEKLKQLNIHTVRDLFETRSDWGGIMINEYKKLTHGAVNSKVYSYQEAMRIINENWAPGNKVSKSAAGNIWVSVSTQGITFANKMHGPRMVQRARKFFSNIGLSCISNFNEIEIEFDHRKFDIMKFHTDDVSIGKKLAKVIQFPTQDHNQEYYEMASGF